MVTGLETDKVRRVIRDSLCLEDNVLITPETRLIDLGCDEVDLLALLPEIGIQANKYVIDHETRKIGDYGEDISCVAKFERSRGNLQRYDHLMELVETDRLPNAGEKLPRLKSLLTVRDLESFYEYIQSRPTNSGTA